MEEKWIWCPLFVNIEKSDLKKLLICLNSTVRLYQKEDFILQEGNATGTLGIVLEGAVHIVTEDVWGNRSLLDEVSAPGLFAEAFAFAKTSALPVSVLAAGTCEVLFINARRILTTCPSACAFHTKLIENTLQILAQKNVSLVEKMRHITRRTTREKLLSYFSRQAKLHASREFDIPFNRQQLADYLAVERSACSVELSKMQKDGLIIFQKNHFILL